MAWLHAPYFIQEEYIYQLTLQLLAANPSFKENGMAWHGMAIELAI